MKAIRLFLALNLFAQSAWAQSAPQTPFTPEMATEAIARVSQTLPLQPLPPAPGANAPAAQKLTYKQQLGSGLIKSIASLIIMTVVDEMRVRIHKEHIQMDRRNIEQLSQEAVAEVVTHQQVLYKVINQLLSQPALLGLGNIINKSMTYTLEKVVGSTNFQKFLASSAAGIVMTLGLESIVQLMQYSTQMVIRNGYSYGLSDKQLQFLSLLNDPKVYNTTYFLAGMWSKDPDKQVVHRLIAQEVVFTFIRDKTFREAFYSQWVRNQLTGDTAVRLGAMMLTQWVAMQITAMVVGGAGATVGTVAEPGGGTAAGAAVGFWGGVGIGLLASFVVGLTAASIPQESKDGTTVALRYGYTQLNRLFQKMNSEIVEKINSVAEDTPADAAIMTQYTDMEYFDRYMSTAMLQDLDLLKLFVQRIEELSTDLYFAQVRHAELKNKGWWTYLKNESMAWLGKTSLLLGPVGTILPIEPPLAEIIYKDKRLIEGYLDGFKFVSKRLVGKMAKAQEKNKSIAELYANKGLSDEALKRAKMYSELRIFFEVLCNSAIEGALSWGISPEYLRSRQTIERIAFWNFTPSQVHAMIMAPVETR